MAASRIALLKAIEQKDEALRSALQRLEYIDADSSGRYRHGYSIPLIKEALALTDKIIPKEAHNG